MGVRVTSVTGKGHSTALHDTNLVVTSTNIQESVAGRHLALGLRVGFGHTWCLLTTITWSMFSNILRFFAESQVDVFWPTCRRA